MSSDFALSVPAWKSDALSLFQRLLPASFLEPFEKHKRQNNRVYTFLVVMWLLIAQRLQPLASLETAVLELLRGLPSTFWPQPCQRVQDWRHGRKSLSSHTGAYNKARLALPLIVVEQSCDRIFQQLTVNLNGTLPALGVRAFFVDGTTVRMAHSPALCQAYPLGSNQHGEAHWPLLRMLVAHDLQTGLALRPEWGPLHGPQAVSEQRLVEAAMDRLPEGSVMVDRRRHPDLPADACVRGRLIARQVQPNNGAAPFLLYLFATVAAGSDEVLNLYGQRWNIETDLRSLKSTLELEQLSCTTPEMVAKELNMAMAAYNLVRAITYIAAERAGIPPRGYSFTRVRNVVEAFTPLVANAKSPQEAQKYFDQMMYYVGQAKLPNRKKRRPSYPRAVWGRPKSFPHQRE
jgi:hypothetical protein